MLIFILRGIWTESSDNWWCNSQSLFWKPKYSLFKIIFKGFFFVFVILRLKNKRQTYSMRYKMFRSLLLMKYPSWSVNLHRYNLLRTHDLKIVRRKGWPLGRAIKEGQKSSCCIWMTAFCWFWWWFTKNYDPVKATRFIF